MFPKKLQQQIPSLQAKIRTDGHDSPDYYRIWKVDCFIHKSSPLLPILRQLKVVCTLMSCFLMIQLILFSHLRLGLPSAPLPSGFQAKIL
jgi:hypothetical protein